MKSDVLIIGGGVIGTSIAYEMAKSGLSVGLLEKRAIGSGASGSSAAMIEFQIDAHRGDPFYSLSKSSRDLFPSLYEEIREVSGEDFEYESDGIIQLAINPGDAAYLKEEAQRQAKLGLRARWLEPEDIEKRFPFLNTIYEGGAFYEEDGQVNGERFTHAMAEAAKKKGVKVIDQCGDISWIKQNGSVSGVKTAKDSWEAKTIILAAGAWTELLVNGLGFELGITPVRGQMLVFDTPNRFLGIPLYTRSNGYITPKKDGFTFVGTTVEYVGYDESTTEEARKNLMNVAVTLVPNFAKKNVRGLSSGLRPGSPDGLPFLGPLPAYPNVLIASGHYRNGIMLAPITAKILSALVTGEKSPVIIDPFLPDRHLKPLKSPPHGSRN